MDTGRCKDLQAECDGAISLLRDARDNGERVSLVCDTITDVLIRARENLRSQNVEIHETKKLLTQAYSDLAELEAA